MIEVVLKTQSPVEHNEFILDGDDVLTMDGMLSDANALSVLFYRLESSDDNGVYSRTARLNLGEWTVPLPWRLKIHNPSGRTRWITATTTSLSQFTEGPE